MNTRLVDHVLAKCPPMPKRVKSELLIVKVARDMVKDMAVDYVTEAGWLAFEKRFFGLVAA